MHQAKVFSFIDKLGFFVIISLAFIMLKFLYFATALEQSPSVIIDIFFEDFYLLLKHNLVFLRQEQTIFLKMKHLLSTKGNIF